MSSKRFTIVLGSLIVAFFAHIGYADAVRTWQNLQEQKEQIEELNVQYGELDQKLNETLETQSKSQEELERLEKEKKKLEAEQKRLEAELQAKADARLAEASKQVINRATRTTAVSASGYMTNCGDNQYAAYIYGQESGGRVDGRCNPSATNPYGCFGIGQDCNDVLLNKCGADYDCQNRFFNNYAQERYDGWANAYAFHIGNGWW